MQREHEEATSRVKMQTYKMKESSRREVRQKTIHDNSNYRAITVFCGRCNGDGEWRCNGVFATNDEPARFEKGARTKSVATSLPVPSLFVIGRSLCQGGGGEKSSTRARSRVVVILCPNDVSPGMQYSKLTQLIGRCQKG